MEQAKEDIKKFGKDNSTQEPFFKTLDMSGYCKIPLKTRVQILLQRVRMSQNELADKVGVNPGTMSKIVNLKWKPTSIIKLRMAYFLEVDSLVLFGNEEYFKDYQKTLQKIEEKEK